MAAWNVAGLGFDHGHMDGLLESVDDHPDAKLVGLCDDNRERSAADVEAAARRHGLTDRVFTDPGACIEATDPDVVVLCPAYADHADWVEAVAPHGVDVLLEKAFAASLADVDRIVSAMDAADGRLMVNWPLGWVAAHRTTRRLIAEGVVGEVHEVHYYDGNSGPNYPGPHPRNPADTDDRQVDRGEGVANGWFYDADLGGGSLLDYLGYGTTLGTWFRDGEMPTHVTTVAHVPDGLEVDEQSVTVARYDAGLSTFQTRWGTFTSPWEHQPQPKCGFVVTGSEGTIASYDYEETVRVQTREDPGGREVPVDDLSYPTRDPVEYFLHCLETGDPVEGPFSPALSRKGQQIVETAVRSADRDETVELVA
jgi:glucose-fructose oxidoreductase